MAKNTSEIYSSTTLLQRLCCKITGLSNEAVLPYYQCALRILGSNFAHPNESDEFQVAEKIKRQLASRGREKDAALFSELHRKLQTQGVLHDRWAVLYFLMTLINSDPATTIGKRDAASSLFGHSLPSFATSTPYHPPGRGEPDSQRQGATTLQGSASFGTASSGVSSIRSDARSGDPTPIPQSFMPSHLATPSVNAMDAERMGRSLALRLGNTMAKSSDSESALVPRRGAATTPRSTIPVHKDENTSFEIAESELLKDVVYVLQGIEGKWVKMDSGRDCYKIDSQAGIPKAIRQEVQKLSECGWLYNKIKNYVESRRSDKAFGLVGQSFCAALQQELTEYYRIIAILESQLHLERDQGYGDASDGLTLRKLVVWTFDPLFRLKTLAALVDVCKGKKGGALTSTIYSYTQHGDPNIRALVHNTLNMVSQPVYATLLRWIYDGELEDTYHEFFVASDPTVKNDRLWHDKYSLRKSMIPTFITMDQARRILLSGKSINFLRQVCQDRTPTRGREAAMTTDNKQGVTMSSQDSNNVFQEMVDSVYKETSQHLLHVLHSKYKFLDHLKAMRRYLLLGQGDFIRHLMDLLEEDLAKPASNLYLHNLTGILETAVRATNAQFDDSDILKRLDVRLLEVSPGDTGWDVFSLDYHMDGPIRTVFTPECMRIYLRVFNFLWRAKRMEYILAVIWKNQMSNSKLLRVIPELSSILHQCHILGCEMVHFIQQVQYYINFEVLECCWDELLTKVNEAEDLDFIIAAHQVFLDSIISRCLLDEKSRAILTQLRTIFDLIIQFQSAQETFYQNSTEELASRKHFLQLKARRTTEGQWAVTEEEEVGEARRQAEWLQATVPSTRAQLTVLAQSYQDMVQQFLAMLTSHQDPSLRFLSFRLDFNQHYRARQPQPRPSTTRPRRQP